MITNPNRDGHRPSPDAARELLEAIAAGQVYVSGYEADAVQGATDCDEGCTVEADGSCPHGYLSAARTAGLI